jgi:hypothetical protein
LLHDEILELFDEIFHGKYRHEMPGIDGASGTAVNHG